MNVAIGNASYLQPSTFLVGITRVVTMFYKGEVGINVSINIATS